MPFTFSHPAIILPFTKIRASYVSASCLITGSIIPDFEYLITMKASGRFGHTILGAFILDLPIALVAVLIFHLLVKKSLINNLPHFFHSRLRTLRDVDFLKNFRQYSVGYILCLLVGIFSHLAWDSVTHANEFFVVRLEVLTASVNFMGLPEAPLFRYVQHGSSLLGFSYMVYFFQVLPRENKNQIKINISYWVGILILSIVIFLIRNSFGFEYFADVAATVMSSVVLSIIVISIIFMLRLKPKQ